MGVKMWRGMKSKYLWNEIIDLNQEEDGNLLSVSQYKGVVPRGEYSRSESLVGYKKVKPGQLVMNIMLAWMRGLGVSDHAGVVSPAYAVFQPSASIISAFAHYLYRTETYLTEFAKKSTGVVPSRWRMYPDSFGQVITNLPPLPTQTRIANFLDEKTALIDKAIAQKQRLIELLEERRQILIHQAVTRGLDPNVELRDSGVDWIGMVPKHWEVKSLKHLLYKIIDCEHKTAPFEDDTGLWVVGTGSVKQGEFVKSKARETSFEGYAEWTQRGIPRPGDVLLTREAPVGEACVVPDDVPICLGQRMVWLKIIEEANADWLVNMIYSRIFSTYFVYRSIGSTVSHLNISDIGKCVMPVPSLEEQLAIAEYCTLHTSSTVQITNQIEGSITFLREYKSTLINAAVTGQIEV